MTVWACQYQVDNYLAECRRRGVAPDAQKLAHLKEAAARERAQLARGEACAYMIQVGGSPEAAERERQLRELDDWLR
jgi:hypothetical protein